MVNEGLLSIVGHAPVPETLMDFPVFRTERPIQILRKSGYGGFGMEIGNGSSAL